MQQDADLLDALYTDLAELTALHAPSGSEQPVIARLRDLFTPLVDAVAVDHMGNLTATREGPQGAPHVVISAHADEIGAIVTSIEPEGFLRLAPLGGVQSRLLEGRAVWVGGHPGVIGARSGHLTPQGEQGRGVSIVDLYVVSTAAQCVEQTWTSAVLTAHCQSSLSEFLPNADRLLTMVMPKARSELELRPLRPVIAPPLCVSAHLQTGLACQSLPGCPSDRRLPSGL
jgi:hypothetical protein